MKPLHKFKLKNLKKLHARTWCIESGFRGTIILPGLRTLASSSSHCCAWSPDTERDPSRDEEFKFNICSTWVVKALKKQTKNQDSKQRGHSYGWNVNCLPIAYPLEAMKKDCITYSQSDHGAFSSSHGKLEPDLHVRVW